MSWQQNRGPGRQSLPVTAQALEERINMYISAMDKAAALNNLQQSSQLQRDIQLLVDLMERVSAGQAVCEAEVPPPLDITPQNDILANPLGELSSRMSEYHKALYFAEEELSDQRINKIKDFQRGLHLMHSLQKRAQDGFPIRADEIPPSVVIPSDDEFDNDAVNTLNGRISQYKAVLASAQNGQEGDRRKVPKILSGLRTLEFLMTRAKARRPVWKRDIPPEFDYYGGEGAQDYDKSINKAKIVLQVRSLLARCSKVHIKNKEKHQSFQSLLQSLRDMDKALTSNPSHGELKKIHSSLMKLKMDVDGVEKFSETEDALAEQLQEEKSKKRVEDLALIDARIGEYKTAALNAKRDNQVEHAIKHFKVLKGLQSLKEQLGREIDVDMTLVPPPPPVFTPVNESQPPLPSARDGPAGSSVNGAAADLSPVLLKPPLETAEDRLAKQLSSYLDEGNTMNVASVTNKNSESGAVSQPESVSLKAENPPVEANENSDISGNSKNSSSRSLSLDEIGSLPCGEGGVEPRRNDDVLPQEESSETSPGAEFKVDGALRDIKPQLEEPSQNPDNALSFSAANEISSSPVTESSFNENVQEFDEKNTKGGDGWGEGDVTSGRTQMSGIAETTSAVEEEAPSPPRTSEIYNRKTLDSVGFLSCQNVPQVTYNQESLIESSALVPSAQIFPPGVRETISEEVNNVSKEIPSSPTQSVEPSIDNAETVSNDVGGFHSSSGDRKIDVEECAVEGLLLPEEAGTQSLKEKSASHLVISDAHPHSSLSSIDGQVTSTAPTSLSATQVNEGEVARPVLDSSSNLPDVTGGANSLEANLNVKNTVQIQDNTTEIHSDSGVSATSAESLSNPTELKDTSPVTPQELLVGSMSSETVLKSDPFKNEKSTGDSISANDDLEFQDLMESMSMPNISAQAIPPVSSGGLDSLSVNDASSSSDTHSLPAIPGSPTSCDREKLRSVQKSVPPSNFSLSNQNNEMEHQGLMLKNNVCVSDQVNFGSNPATISSLPPVLLVSKEFSSEPQNIPTFENVTQPRGPDLSLPFSSGHAPPIHSSPGSGSPVVRRSPIKQCPSMTQNGQGFDLRDIKMMDPNAGNTEVTLRCLENLKYDFLLAETKSSSVEAEQLRDQMSKIKRKLRNGGRQTWDVYKHCVQSELASTERKMEEMRCAQQWDEVQLLSQKKTLAERELAVLRVRLPELNY
ncbi:uncharacterized protein LOC101854088 isoform X2 [Aplysia californica]|nr:uncharacterized protein LOC101854088 isoform X2 [Aplysia californica]